MGGIFSKNIRRAIGAFVFLLILSGASAANAAVLYITPKTTATSIGKTIDVTVRVESGDQGFNAAQATIQFPKEILNVQSVSYSGAATTFDYWLDEPTFSNEKGTVTFLGGTQNGVVGAALPLLTITFVAKGNGDAAINPGDAAVTASDGSGTNILTSVGGAHVVVSPALQASTPETSVPEVVVPAPAPSAPDQVVKPELPVINIVAPVKINRKATIARELPEMPVVKVGVFPDPTKWYNYVTNFLAEWNLPSDITDVAAVVSNEANVNPSSGDGLIAAKTFAAVNDGISYLHVRFKNNIGWGPTAHYRIAIDTAPPSNLNITSEEDFTTANPAPTLHFESSDGLSGTQLYVIRVDTRLVKTQSESTYTLPLMEPGKHTVTVRAVDYAGNIREKNLQFNILPREVPLITIGNLKISKTIFFTFTSFGFVLAFVAGWLFFRWRQKQTSRQVVIAQRDVVNIFSNINREVDIMLHYYADNRVDEREAQEMLVHLKKIKDAVERSQKYIIQNINEIGE